MTKEQMLEILMLLSRLESWAWSCDKRLPDWMAENLDTMIERLSKEVLK